MELKEYAKKILEDHDCDEHTYGGEYSKYILRDLKEGYPDGMEFPYIDVANAILGMSTPEPISRAPWRIVFDTDTDCDGIDCESFEQAEAYAIDILTGWAVEQTRNYPLNPKEWSEKQAEDWDYMYWNCVVWVNKYNSDTDEYDEYWSPSNEDYEAIRWMKYEDLIKKINLARGE